MKRPTSSPVNEYLRLMSAGEKLELIAARYGVKANAIGMALQRAGLPSSMRTYAEWIAAGNEAPDAFVGPILPREHCRKGTNPRMLTLEIIHGRCDAEGDCLVWSGAMTSHKEGTGCPSARHNNKTANLRRLVWSLTHPGKQLPDHLLVVPSCRNERCLNQHHLKTQSRAAYSKRLAAAGVFSNPEANLHRIAGARAVAPRLNMEIAREIRASDEPPKVWAERLGVSRSLIGQVRQNLLWAEAPRGLPVNSVFALGGMAA